MMVVIYMLISYFFGFFFCFVDFLMFRISSKVYGIIILVLLYMYIYIYLEKYKRD